MHDLIDRQAAIDAMEKAKKQYFDRRIIIGKMQDIVNNLPSAQPERFLVADEKVVMRIKKDSVELFGGQPEYTEETRA